MSTSFSIQLIFLVKSLFSQKMISSSQCRAARGLLDWSQQRLADAASVGIVTVRHFEAGKVAPRPATLVVIKQALTAAGVEFIEGNGGGEGVRFRKSKKRK